MNGKTTGQKNTGKDGMTMAQIMSIVNICLGVVFTLCYFYQFVYIFIAYLGKKRKLPDAPPKKLAILIAARNESEVIHNLINSLNAQDYPKEFYKIFLVADNCTDNTAEIARAHGAVVYERFNNVEKGKGYALDYLIKCIERDYGDDACDAYVVFDADNTAEPNYLTEMNKTHAAGYDVVSSYRNASNYGDGWRAAGQGMYFLRDARILNMARMRIDSNTFIAGTGFLFSRELCKKYGGWPFHTLTEDGEFTMHNAVNGAKTGYSNDAIFYDEQATDRKTSWNQKLRWCKGGLQIYSKYGAQLFRGLFSRKFLGCLDMMMCLAPAYFLSLLAVALNVIGYAVMLITDPALWTEIFWQGGSMIGGAYSMLLIFSLVITISDWKRIRGSAAKKILYIFTFPLFIFTFIPAAFVAIFKKVEWKQVQHKGTPTAVASDTESGADSEKREDELVTK